MKKEKGITLTSLVITIIILLIIASISVFSGTHTIKYAKWNKAKSEMETVQTQVNAWHEEYKNLSETKIKTYINDIGEELTADKAENAGEEISKLDDYRFLSAEYIKDKFGIDGNNEFIVNIETRDVILYKGIEYEGEKYYTSEDFNINNTQSIEISGISFDVKQGNGNEVIISNLKLIYPGDNNTSLSKFRVQYKKENTSYFIDVTSNLIKYTEQEEKDGMKQEVTKFKFKVVGAGSYTIKVSTIDGKQSDTKIIYIFPALEVASISPTDWTNQDVTVTLPTVKDFITVYTTDGTAPITSNSTAYSKPFTVSENCTVIYAYKGGDEVYSTTKTIEIANIDKTAPTFNATISNVSSSGYDVIITGVSDTQSGVNRIQCPTWTESNGQDDIDGSWQTSAKSKATKQSDGSYKFRVNITDHKNENGKYITHVYGYDNVGNNKAIALTTTVPAVKITWNSNGGTAVNATSGKAGNAIGTLPTTTRTGYTFAGWFTAASGGTQITTSSTYPTNGDVTYYAHWNVNQYTLTYNGNGGTPSKTSQTTKYDTAWGTLATATRTGYSFEGWYTAASGGTQVTDTTVCKGNTTVYAKWKLITLRSCYGEWNSTSPFLGNSTITRNMIERVNLVKSISGHSTNDDNCWDVSDSQNGKILAWYEDADSDGYYEVTIGQEGGINANPNSSLLFSYIGYNGDDTTVINGIENLNTSNVTNMRRMFDGCSNLTSLDVSKFDTSNVTDMIGMFSGCQKLTSLDVSKFDTSNVTDMNDMFRDCSKLTSLDVSNFDTSKVTDMGFMFDGCSKLTSLDVSKFDTSNVTYMSHMFFDCNNLTNLDLSNFDTSNVTGMSGMFYFCYNLTSLDVSNFDTSNVTDMGWMFHYCQNLTSLDVSKFNTSKVTDMYRMFSLCYNLTSLDVSKFDTSNVTRMDNMFSGCSNLTSLDVSKFDTSKVTDMELMFSGCEKLTSLDVSKFDTSKVTDMGAMFMDCNKLTSLDVSKFDTSKVTDMGAMFAHCQNLTSLDVSKFDTSKVTEMGSMFSKCQNLTSLDLSNFDTSKVTSMWYMFYDCDNLTSLDLSKFDTSKVTNMDSMFEDCKNLTSLDVSKFDTSKVTDMGYMFHSCQNLTSLDVSKFDTSKVTDMGYMFGSCENLTSLDVSKFNTSNVTNMRSMFYGCSELVTIYVGNKWNTDNVTSSYDMFTSSTSLVGGAGTTYNDSHTNKAYAHIDGGPSNPGYFTSK